VRDVVDALVRLARHPQAPGRVLNVGGTEEVTIEDLARRIRTLAGSSSPIIHVPYEDVYSPGFEDMQRRVPDISRLQSLLGWRAQHSLDDCLKSVIEYERGRIAG